MKDLQEPEPQPEPPFVEPVVPDEEGGKKDDKNDAEKNDTSAGFKDAKTNDNKHDKKDGEQDDKKENDGKKEPEPRATADTAPQDQEQIGNFKDISH